ncbi:MAG: hypothetical protein ACK4QW_13570 [Alphaproteobacteria bacterium]
MNKIAVSALSAAMLVTGGLAMAQTSATSPGQPADQATKGQATTGQTTTGQTTGQTTPGQTPGQATTGQATTGAAATAGAMGQTAALNEQTVRSALQQHGFTEVSEVKVRFEAKGTKDGNTYEIRGKMSDKPAQRAGMSDDEVRSKLESEGYSDVGDLKREGQRVSTTAEKDGQKVKLHADLASGLMSPPKQ